MLKKTNLSLIFGNAGASHRSKMRPLSPPWTRVDWAQVVRELLEVHYPEAPTVKLVMDNLNTHSIASLYQAFDPETARSLAKRLEIHYTPKHGSWLNIAEIELSVLSDQCFRASNSKHRPII
ncbi:transposase [Paenibacillus albidus]|uniref:transposase n=1 Tax=Paenibacillus albidus TaxID=2041023 RepID=UPI001BE9D8B1|nr:transposase [Paenibacillus albidus]MBT2293202.1 transposase [Paenibacillus albidus]